MFVHRQHNGNSSLIVIVLLAILTILSTNLLKNVSFAQLLLNNRITLEQRVQALNTLCLYGISVSQEDMENNKEKKIVLHQWPGLEKEHYADISILKSKKNIHIFSQILKKDTNKKLSEITARLKNKNQHLKIIEYTMKHYPQG